MTPSLFYINFDRKSSQFPINHIICEFNYLGILLNRTGHFNKATTKQAEKAKQAMYEVLKRGRTHNLSVECQLELFDEKF
jgi:hypothetical protein